MDQSAVASVMFPFGKWKKYCGSSEIPFRQEVQDEGVIIEAPPVSSHATGRHVKIRGPPVNIARVFKAVLRRAAPDMLPDTKAFLSPPSQERLWVFKDQNGSFVDITTAHLSLQNPVARSLSDDTPVIHFRVRVELPLWLLVELHHLPDTEEAMLPDIPGAPAGASRTSSLTSEGTLGSRLSGGLPAGGVGVVRGVSGPGKQYQYSTEVEDPLGCCDMDYEEINSSVWDMRGNEDFEADVVRMMEVDDEVDVQHLPDVMDYVMEHTQHRLSGVFVHLHLVLDTNILISGEWLLRALSSLFSPKAQLHEGNSTGADGAGPERAMRNLAVSCVLPRRVYAELDGLKKGNTLTNVMARTAFTMLEDGFKSKEGFWVLQTKKEYLDAAAAAGEHITPGQALPHLSADESICQCAIFMYDQLDSQQREVEEAAKTMPQVAALPTVLRKVALATNDKGVGVLLDGESGQRTLPHLRLEDFPHSSEPSVLGPWLYQLALTGQVPANPAPPTATMGKKSGKVSLPSRSAPVKPFTLAPVTSLDPLRPRISEGSGDSMDTGDTPKGVAAHPPVGSLLPERTSSGQRINPNLYDAIEDDYGAGVGQMREQRGRGPGGGGYGGGGYGQRQTHGQGYGEPRDKPRGLGQTHVQLPAARQPAHVLQQLQGVGGMSLPPGTQLVQGQHLVQQAGHQTVLLTQQGQPQHVQLVQQGKPLQHVQLVSTQMHQPAGQTVFQVQQHQQQQVMAAAQPQQTVLVQQVSTGLPQGVTGVSAQVLQQIPQLQQMRGQGQAGAAAVTQQQPVAMVRSGSLPSAAGPEGSAVRPGLSPEAMFQQLAALSMRQGQAQAAAAAGQPQPPQQTPQQQMSQEVMQQFLQARAQHQKRQELQVLMQQQQQQQAQAAAQQVVQQQAAPQQQQQQQQQQAFQQQAAQPQAGHAAPGNLQPQLQALQALLQQVPAGSPITADLIRQLLPAQAAAQRQEVRQNAGTLPSTSPPLPQPQQPAQQPPLQMPQLPPQLPPQLQLLMSQLRQTDAANQHQAAASSSAGGTDPQRKASLDPAALLATMGAAYGSAGPARRSESMPAPPLQQGRQPLSGGGSRLENLTALLANDDDDYGATTAPTAGSGGSARPGGVGQDRGGSGGGGGTGGGARRTSTAAGGVTASLHELHARATGGEHVVHSNRS